MQYLQEISRDHIHSALRRELCWADIGKRDGFDLIVTRQIVHVLVDPRVKRALILDDASSKYIKMHM